jgi:hypothetical protein
MMPIPDSIKPETNPYTLEVLINSSSSSGGLAKSITETIGGEGGMMPSITLFQFFLSFALQVR